MFILKANMSRGLEVGPLGKPACLLYLNSEKMAHMESITFYCKQHKNLYFLRQTFSFRIALAKPQTSSHIAETYGETTPVIL